MFARRLSRTDRLLEEADRALSTAFGTAHEAERASPAIGIDEAPLDESARKHAAGLMRVNHTGEVCAQALYSGQAAVARGWSSMRARGILERLRQQLAKGRGLMSGQECDVVAHRRQLGRADAAGSGRRVGLRDLVGAQGARRS